jgi:flagellar biosynthesis/type III secretory pathway protein FliH
MSAYERGYQDGLYTGANDGRRKQTYDPDRSHFYNDTPGYDPSLGSRDVYRQAYRDGFLHGYREGYQNWQKYFAGGVFHK